METMNYNRKANKKSWGGLVSFVLFTVVGVTAAAYLIINEPEPVIIGEDMYIPVNSSNTNGNNNVNIYSEEQIASIKYTVKNNTSKYNKGNFKSNIAVPEVAIEDVELTDLNDEMLNKFLVRYNAVKSEMASLEHTFTYKVTFNKYESMVGKNRILSFTFYERIVDDSTGEDVTYKLYAYNIDLVNKKVVSQDDIAVEILGSTYKTIIKEKVKEYVIKKKLFDEESYNYSLTGLEEFYIKDGQLHIMFNPGEMGDNKDYLDIKIVK